MQKCKKWNGTIKMNLLEMCYSDVDITELATS